MNEELIRKAIEFKLNTAEKILGRLPSGTTEKIRTLGHLICESVGEHLGATAKDAPQNSKTSGKVNNVIID